MNTKEFNKIANWVMENDLSFVMGFIPPEYHETLYGGLQDYAKWEYDRGWDDCKKSIKIFFDKSGYKLKED